MKSYLTAKNCCAVAVAALLLLSAAELCLAADPWADRVRRFQPGAGAGFGADQLPAIVLGPPVGAGALEGSSHVVSLGNGGSLTLAFRDNLIFDGPGDDFVVYENAFYVGANAEQVFTEYAFVEVSDDRRHWLRFDFDPATGRGLAGRTPVWAGVEIDPLGLAAGGDRFDIADLGLSFVRYLRLVDVDGQVADLGDSLPSAGSAGFDLDAAAALNSSRPGRVLGRVVSAGAPLEGALVRLIPLGDGRRLRRRTRASGRFRFARVLPSGDYRLKARLPGKPWTTAVVYLDLEQLLVSRDLQLQ